MGASAKLVHTDDPDRIGTCAIDPRSHLVEHDGGVDNLRILCGVVQCRPAFCQNGCQHDIYRRSAGHEIEKYLRSIERISLDHVMVLTHLHFGSKGP